MTNNGATPDLLTPEGIAIGPEGLDASTLAQAVDEARLAAEGIIVTPDDLFREIGALYMEGKVARRRAEQAESENDALKAKVWALEEAAARPAP